MTEEEKEMMKRFGITVEQKSVYTYKGYKYEHLKDALNYAKVVGAAHKSSVPSA
jgi:ribosome maturation protein Sdo1